METVKCAQESLVTILSHRIQCQLGIAGNPNPFISMGFKAIFMCYESIRSWFRVIEYLGMLMRQLDRLDQLPCSSPAERASPVTRVYMENFQPG